MKNTLFLKAAVAVAFVAVIAVNFLANALPINGVTTGEASDTLGNLFAPAGVTFAIWGLIYVLLLGYTVYQFGLTQKNKGAEHEKLFYKINKYYFVTSFANIAWIFAWHYGVIWLSLIFMIILLVFLIKIADVINKEKYDLKDTLFIRVPFSVYFGWITVATIANVTAFLVSINWNGFGIPETVWTIIVLLVGSGIGIARTLKDKNIFYGLVLVWAYGGIWLKHTSPSGFEGAYPNIITTVILCIVLFLGTIGYLGYKQFASKRVEK
jgi:hypothetical protein